MLCCPPFFVRQNRSLYWRCIAIKEQQINEAIRDKEVRLIGEDGEQLGIMSSRQAMEIATAKELDLVKISPNANPPVCKIMDYGKYKYESAKREKESKKKQKIVVLKELRLRPFVEENDLKTKAKMGLKFLDNGDKLKVSVRFRGRELGHKDIGFTVLEKFVELIREKGTPVDKPKMEGSNLVIMIEPNKK